MSAAELARLVSEAGGAALGLEAAIDQTDPHAVPDLVSEELPQLESLTKQLDEADCPAEARGARDALVRGLRTFQQDLMDVSEEAFLAASQGDAYQSGLLSASVSWTGGGGRMRWELSQSQGLAAVKEALAELKVGGFTNSGL
jgi:hypothetical protein